MSQRAAQETLPLRDAFAVLFFVSVGMLFNPMIVVREPLPVLATVFIILIGKSVAAFAIVKLFGHSRSTALTISASLAQIGEFSFILAGLGVSLALLPERGRDLILAGAILSILINPLLFAVLDRFQNSPKTDDASKDSDQARAREPLPVTSLSEHVVLIGHGRVGSYISGVLKEKGVTFLVVEDNHDAVAELRKQGIEAIAANAADPEVITAVNIAGARCLLVAIPDAFEGGQVVEQARNANASLPIIARAHSQAEIEHLQQHGANIVVMGEHEIAKTMIADIPGHPA